MREKFIKIVRNTDICDIDAKIKDNSVKVYISIEYNYFMKYVLGLIEKIDEESRKILIKCLKEIENLSIGSIADSVLIEELSKKWRKRLNGE